MSGASSRVSRAELPYPAPQPPPFEPHVPKSFVAWLTALGPLRLALGLGYGSVLPSSVHCLRMASWLRKSRPSISLRGSPGLGMNGSRAGGRDQCEGGGPFSSGAASVVFPILISSIFSRMRMIRRADVPL